MNNLVILFFGYGESGLYCLSSLIKKNIDVSTVVLSDKEKTNTIAKLAKKNKLPIVIFSKSNRTKSVNVMKKYKPELVIVASFPYLLPKNIYEFPKYGAINVHAGKLPQYRGYHPINWAIINNEHEIGVTIHYIDDGIDSGDILLQETIPVSDFDDINSIKNKAIQLGARLLVKVVKQIIKEKEKIRGEPQDHATVTYAPKRSEKDGKIDWNKSAREIFNLIRALKKPYPNAFAYSKSGKKIEFQESFMPKKTGQVIAKIKDLYLITTGDGVMLVKSKQKLSVGDILK